MGQDREPGTGRRDGVADPGEASGAGAAAAGGGDPGGGCAAAGEGPPVLVDVRDGIGRITLNRPRRRNAVTLELLEALVDAIAAVAADADCRAVVLSGNGGALCAGADLAAGAAGGDDPGRTMDAASRVILGIVDCPAPVVCAATGASAGFGIGLALASDITVMAADARFAFAFAKLGLMPDGGVGHLLPALAGRQAAARIVMLAEDVPAPRALELGLVAEVADSDPGARERAGAIASEIAAMPPAGMALTKRTLAAGVRAGLAEALAAERRGQAGLLTSPEFLRAAAAFAGRSRPAGRG